MRRLSKMRSLLLLLMSLCTANGQIGFSPNVAQVKISEHPFPVSSAIQLTEITWTMLGKAANQEVYCVSESPVSQLRFVCVDCPSKNITDITDVLNNNAQDMTQTAGFPTVALRAIEANPNWTGVSIVCQAKVYSQGISSTINSSPAIVNVKYLRQVHVVDDRNQFPVVIPDQGLHFYVECNRDGSGLCVPGRRKTLRCSVQSNPPTTTFKWLKNGVQISSESQEITIGTEMIGQSIQCWANNGLYADEGISSEAVYIDPYCKFRILLLKLTYCVQLPLATNKIQITQKITLSCTVEGNPRPAVYWRLRKSNSKITTKIINCRPILVRLQSTCELHVTNYSFSGQYWCSACSAVSRGMPECNPGLDAPGERLLTIQVQGPPMEAEIPAMSHTCAEPAPRPPREITFEIDNNAVQVGQTWQNFQFINIMQNNSMPSCHIARLKISPVYESDQSRQIILKLQNDHGPKIITVSLADLLGGGSSNLSAVPTWLLTILGVIAFGLVCVILVIVCMRQQLFCFNDEKTAQAQYSNDNYKTPIPDNYSDDQRGLYGAKDSEVMNHHHEQVYMSREAVV
ncbi:hypothetical protein M3Y97_00830400 [Aphelenchoides bicaudatus]|nr:hypothetical protein M3Y97_00830400 [Aphelenchoides bicaudatus]